MSGRKSRRRGHDWERTCARLLSEIEGVDAARNLVETREGNSGDLTTDLPLSIQCKCGRSPSVWRALQEAREAAREGEVPVALVKRSHGRGKPSERVAVLDVEDFVEMLARIHADRREAA